MRNREQFILTDYLMLGTICVIILEFIFIPNLEIVKWMGVLGVIEIFGISITLKTINIFGFTFVPSDLCVFSFIGLTPLLATIFENLGRKKRICPKSYQLLLWPIIFLCLLSLLMGIINNNEALISEFRSFFLSTALFFSFYFVRFSQRADRLSLYLMVFGLFGVQILHLLSVPFPWISQSLILNPMAKGGMLFGLTCSLITTSFCFSQSILGKGFFIWTVLFVISTISIVIHIGQKPLIFGLILVYITIVTASLRICVKNLNRLSIVVSVAFIFLAIGFIMMSSNFKANFIDQFIYRFLKIDDVSSVSEIDTSLLSDAERSNQDVASGRFEIWSYYLSEAMKGYGFTQNGFGYDSGFQLEVDHAESSVGKHNIIIYMAYEFGILASLLIVFLIIKFARLEILNRKTDNPELLRFFNTAEIIGLLGFIFGIIGTAMVGTLLFYPQIAFMFWHSVSILCKERDNLNN